MLKKTIKKLLQSFFYPYGLITFNKLYALHHFFTIKKPRIRTIFEYKITNDFFEYKQNKTNDEWNLFKKNITKEMDEESATFLNNYENKINYILRHNLIDQNNILTNNEQIEQLIVNKKLKKISKELKKYKFSNISAETFNSYNGLRFIPKKQQEKIKEGICIDGGAFEGDTAIMLIEKLQANEVHCFEVESNNYRKLLRTIQISKSKRIKPYLIGLSDHSSSGYVMSDGGSSILIEDANRKEIKIEKLDNLYSSEEKISFIKLDIEGAEQGAIKGAAEIIKRDKPILSLSIYHSIDDFFNIKPLIESIQPGYKFTIKQISPFSTFEEIMLIAYYE